MVKRKHKKPQAKNICMKEARQLTCGLDGEIAKWLSGRL